MSHTTQTLWIYCWKPVTWSGGEETVSPADGNAIDTESGGRNSLWFRLWSHSAEKSQNPQLPPHLLIHMQTLGIAESLDHVTRPFQLLESHVVTQSGVWLKKKIFQYDIQVSGRLIFYPLMLKCFIFLWDKMPLLKRLLSLEVNFLSEQDWQASQLCYDSLSS